MTLSSEPNEIFHDLAENAPVGIFIEQNSAFRYANAAFAALLETDVAGLVDHLGLLNLVMPEDRVATQQHL